MVFSDIISRLPFSQFADTHHEFDHFFWLGDLNYRIEMDRGPPPFFLVALSSLLRFSLKDELMDKVRLKDWGTLKKFDQLINEQNALHLTSFSLFPFSSP